MVARRGALAASVLPPWAARGRCGCWGLPSLPLLLPVSPFFSEEVLRPKGPNSRGKGGRRRKVPTVKGRPTSARRRPLGKPWGPERRRLHQPYAVPQRPPPRRAERVVIMARLRSQLALPSAFLFLLWRVRLHPKLRSPTRLCSRCVGVCRPSKSSDPTSFGLANVKIIIVIMRIVARSPDSMGKGSWFSGKVPRPPKSQQSRGRGGGGEKSQQSRGSPLALADAPWENLGLRSDDGYISYTPCRNVLRPDGSNEWSSWRACAPN